MEVFELIEDNLCMNIIGYIDRSKIDFEELNYLGDDEEFIKNKNNKTEVVLTIDIPRIRKKLFKLYEKNIFSYISHQTSNISKRAEIGLGSVIQANTLISARVNIGKGCFLNHSSAVHHESKIGDFTILAPKSLILGRVTIGNQCYIGAGSIIKENVKIGDNVTIGAGAVVVNNIADNSIVVGNPAKKYLGK